MNDQELQKEKQTQDRFTNAERLSPNAIEPTVAEAVGNTSSGLILGQQPPSPLPGRLGRYQLRQLLGRGGFGAVYRAFDPQLEREVAIKVLRPEILESEEARLRFQREAKAAARLLHPNIVPAHDAGVSDGYDFIAYAYVPGRTLKECIPESGIPQRKAALLALQLAEALASRGKALPSWKRRTF